MEHVDFSYQTDLPVLHDVSLNIRAGETVAVVGPSGGGKTTLCQLIPRFYDVDGGSITVDGHDVRDITQRSLRANIGIVQQDVFLFANTILENIRYGRPDATMEEVVAAAKQAEIYDDIMQMPSALDSLTEAKIQRAFDNLAKGRTTLIIAHRLSTIHAADRIVVIADGEIREEGTQSELLAKDGIFARLYKTQNPGSVLA